MSKRHIYFFLTFALISLQSIAAPRAHATTHATPHATPHTPAHAAALPVVPAPAIDIQPAWRPDLREYLVTTCGAGSESFCQSVCGDSATCVQRENYCRDCAGTSSLMLKDIFDNVGDLYVSNGVAVSLDDLASYLKAGAFVSLTADSVYNFFDTYNSGDLQSRFERLCDYPTPRPVLFLDADASSRELKGVNFVLCHNKSGGLEAFKISRTVEVDKSGNPPPQAPLL